MMKQKYMRLADRCLESLRDNTTAYLGYHTDVERLYDILTKLIHNEKITKDEENFIDDFEG